jgi:hypothetical protein
MASTFGALGAYIGAALFYIFRVSSISYKLAEFIFTIPFIIFALDI